MTDQKKDEGFRLNRYLARAGIASRRKSDGLIAEGLVKVNGSIVTSPGYRVMQGDRVTCMGRRVELQPLLTAVLNKPHGYETTLADDAARSISSLMDGLPPGTVPVGRLDVNTGGLLLLSNDGRLVNRLTHPSWEVEREYRVFLDARPEDWMTVRLRKGARIGRGEFSKPVSVRIYDGRSISIVLHTGRNREVRRLIEACGITLSGLERIRYGPISIKGVERGEWRLLTSKELGELESSVGLHQR